MRYEVTCDRVAHPAQDVDTGRELNGFRWLGKWSVFFGSKLLHYFPVRLIPRILVTLPATPLLGSSKNGIVFVELTKRVASTGMELP